MYKLWPQRLCVVHWQRGTSVDKSSVEVVTSGGSVDMSGERCPYKYLGVERGCTAEEARKAYRRLAMRWHPDRRGGEESDEWRCIAWAWRILGDPDKRECWDAGGGERSLEEAAIKEADAIILHCLDGELQIYGDGGRTDVVAGASDVLRVKIGEAGKNLSLREKRLAGVNRQLKSLKGVPRGSQVVSIMEGARSRLEEEVRGLRWALRVMERARELLRGYSYDFGKWF